MTDYKDVWHTLIADKQKSWVAFENGTCVIIMEPGTDLAQQAQSLLVEHGTVNAGTASGDFSVLELDELPGWVVGCHHPDILNYVSPNDLIVGLPKDMQAGLVGRQQRNDDAEQLNITYIYDAQAPENQS